MERLFLAYWPKLISAAWFSILNLMMLYKYTGNKRYAVERAVSGFFVSSSFVSIIGEQICIVIYSYLIQTAGFKDPYNFIFIFLNLIGDVVFIFIGGNLFSYFTGLKNYQGATIYMEFVCIERLCLVLAISYWGYVVLYFFFQLVLYLVTKDDLAYLFKGSSINWRRVFIYLIGLFYILDLLYAAYFLFPELGTDVLNIQNVMWLDMVAIITSAFVAGFFKISISEAREHDQKIFYFEKLQNSQEKIIATLAQISEAKSYETGQHVRRVGEYSKLIGSKLGMDMLEVENLKVAAMMHDLGKLMISQDIIGKPGKLTPDEYEVVKKHAKYGWEILSKSEGEVMEMASIIALQHHEHWDGNGYPSGLKGREISIYAQIVSVADVFDALTSKRAYKDSWSIEDARAEIINQRGRQFSPTVVDAFLDCFDMIRTIKDTYADE
ncbi:HD-GYP domain-containing protein [Pseudobutyrivibrio xylanivorans]|uniref:HD domain-containing protein n=1 Tax=Pseudobutyrivibrio xylanivorans TaxID=185007 RepID=A0A5P6VUW3_PSEXY|nr:HD domain-containing phosphohydrolase [Pseudobutyrivibrio xylanivorans]QFJ54601.1 HD domain-containing protein [Pseudobutyrivibrio xylanivorans]